MNNIYKVSPDLRLYVQRALAKHYYGCRFFQAEDDTWKCVTGASSSAFHLIVKEARAMQISKQIGADYVDRTMFNKALYIDGIRSFQADIVLDQFL